jgi:purine-binding chemotaxis protein CheW
MELTGILPKLVTDLELAQHKTIGFRKICVISLGGEHFAVDFHHVREVFRIESITPVPGMPAALVGVANLRGVIMPLVDIRSFLGVSAATLLLYAIVARYGSHQVALLVDNVPEIRTISTDDISPLTSNETSAGRRFLSGRVSIDHRMDGIVDLTTLLAAIEQTIAGKNA